MKCLKIELPNWIPFCVPKIKICFIAFYFLLQRMSPVQIIFFLTKMHITPEDARRICQSKQYVNNKNKEFFWIIHWMLMTFLKTIDKMSCHILSIWLIVSGSKTFFKFLKILFCISLVLIFSNIRLGQAKLSGNLAVTKDPYHKLHF